KTFQEAYPTTDLGKVIVLTEPAYTLPGGKVLDADTLFNPRSSRIAGWIGLAGLAVGSFCLWRTFRTPRLAPRAGRGKNERPTPPPLADAYALLARERELSLHPFAWRLVLIRACGRMSGLLLGLAGVIFCLFMGFGGLKTGKPEVLVGFVIFA